MSSVATPLNDAESGSLRAVSKPTHRKPGRTLTRYVLREVTFPTLYAVLALTFVVLTRDLMKFSDLVINRGLGADIVAWMAFFEAVPLMGQMLPFAMLIGVLVALGRLGADREILVLEACGISAPRLVAPIMIFATATFAVASASSLWASPAANRAFDGMLLEVSRENPAASIQSGRVHWFGDWKMEALEVSARGDEMEGVLLRMPEIGETVFAERGTLQPDPTGGTRVTLESGSVILNPRKRPRHLRFDKMTTHLPETEEVVTRDEVAMLAGYWLSELARIARSDGLDEGLRREARFEWHRRFALPTATLVFGFLAVPIFFLRSHFSRSSGGVMAIIATLVYYGLVQLGDGLEHAGWLPVWAAVWLPNFVLGSVAAVLVFRLNAKESFARGAESVRPPRRVAKEGEGARDVRPKQWALQRYVAGRFLQMAVLCFAVVLVAYLVVDVLERLDLFAGYGATGTEVMRYYGARVPILASRVVPMALLVATALTVSVLAVQGELMGMRACGIPAPRALSPILIICALVVPGYFVLNNEILPRANAMASYVKRVEIKNKDAQSGPGSVWHRAGTRLYETEYLDPQAGVARNITIYGLGDRGLPTSRTDARSARHIGNGVWRLRDAVRVESANDGLAKVEAPGFAELGEELPAEVDTRQLSVGELQKEIDEVEQSGYDATAYHVDLHRKLAAPIACLILPALALFFAVAGPPYPSSSLTLVVSVVVAVAYVLLTGVGTSLGYGAVVSPIVAGWAPPFVFAAIAAYLGLRLRGFGQTF